MSRLQVLAAQPRLALGALVTLLLAAGAVVGSGADFTASSANPSNTFAAGTLSILNGKEATSVLTASNMRPADPAQVGTVDIQNTGSLSGAFTLVRGTLTNTDGTNPLAAKLNVVVTDCGVWTNASTANACGDGDDVQKYSGTLAAMGTTNLGTFAAGAKHTYKFAVSLDSSADNAYQGDSATAEFDFNAA
jgi:hypothetical protein